MKLDWTDILDIAIALDEKHPDIDPATVRFTQLRDLVLNLAEFGGAPERCGERVLEAIQGTWIEERDD